MNHISLKYQFQFSLSIIPQLSSSLISQIQTLTHDGKFGGCSNSGRSGGSKSSNRSDFVGLFTWVFCLFWFGFRMVFGRFELILSWISWWIWIVFELVSQ